jgi:hypothetical protein
MGGWMVRGSIIKNDSSTTSTSTSTTRGNPLVRLRWWNDTSNDGNDYGGKLVVHLALLSDAAGIVYYAVTAEAITTVAHVCALLMGAALYSLLAWANHTPRTNRD